MKKQTPRIIYLFAVTVVFGITVSSLHIHKDIYQESETRHHLTENDLYCAICGSLFNFETDEHPSILFRYPSERFYPGLPTETAFPPYPRFQEGRSPPVELTS